ncbi:hypothetical protein [Micromonospora carbonacea]|uniref:hypothetical protein n=1 Tax=Micromonospora carbonacea TaxID=47853 RepID=UPI0037236052
MKDDIRVTIRDADGRFLNDLHTNSPQIADERIALWTAAYPNARVERTEGEWCDHYPGRTSHLPNCRSGGAR